MDVSGRPLRMVARRGALAAIPAIAGACRGPAALRPGAPPQPETRGARSAAPATPAALSPLSVPALRSRAYVGGTVEVLAPRDRHPAFTAYRIAYPSDGLRITGTMAVPSGDGPFPVVLLNHGDVVPAEYETGAGTDEVAALLAGAGYLTAASDYRGYGDSDHDRPGHDDPGHRVEYAIDVLNLLASLPSVPQADRTRVGIWGHSMGGEMALRALEADVGRRIKAAVLWAPTSADMNDNARFYAHGAPEGGARELPAPLNEQLSPITYLQWVAAPVSLHQGDADTEARPEWAIKLRDALQRAGRSVEFFRYPGQDHNFSAGWGEIGPRTVAFFDRFVKDNGRGR